MLARVKFREGVRADLDARTRGSRGGLQLNNVRHLGKKFWR